MFSIDTRQAGWGDLNVKMECLQNGCLVPIKVDERGDGIYNISFVPEWAGKYLVAVTFNQQSVPGSPFMLFADTNDENDKSFPKHRANLSDNHLKSGNVLNLQHNNGVKSSLVAIGECLRYASVGRVASFELIGNFDLKQIALDIAFSPSSRLDPCSGT